MRKLIWVLMVVIFVSGCATVFDARRQQLRQDYDAGKISADTYYSQMSQVDRDQQEWANNFSQALMRSQQQRSQQSTPPPPIVGMDMTPNPDGGAIYTPKKKTTYDIMDTSGNKVGTARER